MAAPRRGVVVRPRAFARPETIPLTKMVGPDSVAVTVRLIRTWMATHPEGNNTLAGFARRAALSPTTVSRILAEETREPRITTIIRCWSAAGVVAIQPVYEESDE